MTWYVVVTRDRRHLVIERYSSVGGAADKIVRHRAFHQWTCLAQDGSKTAPMRMLNRSERKALEKGLYPSLFDE